MDLKRLKYFCAVVEQGNISKAARILNMAQPPLSKRLQELEEEVGASLFLRGTKRIELTPAGHYLYKRACEILRTVDDAARGTALLARAETRTLHIGLSHLYQNYFEELILEMNRKNPDMQIGVSILDSSHLELLLRNGLIDVALIQKPDHVDGFDCISFAPVRLMAVVNKTLAAEYNGPLTLAQVARWPLVLLKRAEGLGTFDWLQDTMRKSGGQPNVIMYATQPGAILGWLQAGMAAATLIPESELHGHDLSQCVQFAVSPAIDVFYPSIVKLTAASDLKEVMELVEGGYPFAEET